MHLITIERLKARWVEASVANEQFVAVLDAGLASCRQATLDAVLPVARLEVRAGTRRF